MQWKQIRNIQSRNQISETLMELNHLQSATSENVMQWKFPDLQYHVLTTRQSCLNHSDHASHATYSLLSRHYILS